jgi:hypothetical protein
MNEQIKEKWMVALRSGDYTQGQGCLRFHKDDQPDKFCCLGVLADLIKTDEEWLRVNGSVPLTWTDIGRHNKDAYEGNELPFAMRERADILEQNCKELIIMNDDGGASFVQIADWIEENL